MQIMRESGLVSQASRPRDSCLVLTVLLVAIWSLRFVTPGMTMSLECTVALTARNHSRQPSTDGTPTMKHAETPELLFADMSRDLGFDYNELTDWGTVNADPNRLDEFLAYFENHIDRIDKRFHALFIYEMTDLIVDSALECIRKDQIVPVDRLARFWIGIRDHRAGSSVLKTVDYVNEDERAAYQQLIEHLTG